MDGPTRRVLVDGIETQSLIPASRIPGAVFTSMRPERLLLGALLMLLLAGVGKAWDLSTSPAVPAGVIGQGVQIDDAERLALLQDIVRTYIDGADRPVAWETDALQGTVVVSLVRQASDRNPDAAPWDDILDRIESVRMRGGYESLVSGMHGGLSDAVRGTVELEPGRVGRGLVTAFFLTPASIWTHDRSFAVMYGMCVLFVLGIGGAAISRMEAEGFAVDREVKISGGLSWAAMDWQRLVGVLFLPPVLSVLLLMVPGILGLLSLIPGVDVFVALIWGAGLVFGLAAALLTVGWLVSFPILVPAAACETGDPAEVVVRTIGLAWRRPFSLLLMMAVAVISGVMGWLLISGLVAVTLNGSQAAGAAFGSAALDALPMTAWPALSEVEPAASTVGDLQGTRWLSGAIFDLWRHFVIALAFGWIVVYAMSAGTRVYLLQRMVVERLEPDELGEPGPA